MSVAGTNFFHDSLSDLEGICESAGVKMAYHVGLLDVIPRRGLLRQYRILVKHLKFCWHLRKRQSSEEIQFIREFSNIPLWIGFRLFGIRGDRICLLIHHNFQWALNRKLNRVAFRSLQRRGCHFLFFEVIPEAYLHDFGMVSGRCHAIPHPVKEPISVEAAPQYTAGLIGTWKSGGESLKAFRQLSSVESMESILVGASNIEEAKGELEASPLPVEFIDTTLPDEFDRAFRACRLVYLAYPQSHYHYRASGLLSDAVRNRVPVLIPDYPVMHQQMSWPVPVGKAFSDEQSFAKILTALLKDRDTTGFDFDGHAAARGASALRIHMKKIFEEML